MMPSHPKKRVNDSGDSDVYGDSDVSSTEELSNWSSESGDYRPKKRARRATKKDPSTNSKARTRASITVLATDTLPNQEHPSDRLSKVDNSILARIKKALALAQHEGTGEQEAKAAFRMASKLMSQHSITQAEILAEEDEAQRVKRAGMSAVSIRSLHGTSVRLEGWISVVANAMTIFFDCKAYSTTFSGGERLEWTFYGLAEQTVAAAYGLEMAYNLIIDWSQQARAGQGRRQKNTYRSGVGDGLQTLAKEEKREEKRRVVEMEKRQLEAAHKQEEEEDKRRLSRLEQPAHADEPGAQNRQHGKAQDTKVKLEVVEDDDDINLLAVPATNNWAQDEDLDSDSEDFAEDVLYGDNTGSDQGFQPDFFDGDDVEDDYIFTPEPSPRPTAQTIKVEEAVPVVDISNDRKSQIDVQVKDEDVEWRSVHQLVAFRDVSVAVADDWLKSQKIKLSKGRKQQARALLNSKERELYRQGKEDAKKIDVRRKRIQGADHS